MRITVHLRSANSTRNDNGYLPVEQVDLMLDVTARE